MIKFGVSSTPINFRDVSKNSEDMPLYLAQYNLDAFEYQCSRGVKISEEKAKRLQVESKKHNILMSVHAPYYISLSTIDPMKQQKSIQYIIDTARVAKWMGATRIVVHSGSLLGLSRAQALKNACRLLKRAIAALKKEGLEDINICPETMGKINQLGSSEEVIALCQVDGHCIPTIDFGHLYCRSLGTLVTKSDWIHELEKYITILGYDRMKYFHSHFSKMEYTEGGEKRHVTFSDTDYGPDYKAVISAILELKLEPRILCESAGTQDIDASAMKQWYLSVKDSI
ncbi:MAG: TIM barrel protein [Coprobacillaceae bacterium]